MKNDFTQAKGSLASSPTSDDPVMPSRRLFMQAGIAAAATFAIPSLARASDEDVPPKKTDEEIYDEDTRYIRTSAYDFAKRAVEFCDAHYTRGLEELETQRTVSEFERSKLLENKQKALQNIWDMTFGVISLMGHAPARGMELYRPVHKARQQLQDLNERNFTIIGGTVQDNAMFDTQGVLYPATEVADIRTLLVDTDDKRSALFELIERIHGDMEAHKVPDDMIAHYYLFVGGPNIEMTLLPTNFNRDYTTSSGTQITQNGFPQNACDTPAFAIVPKPAMK